ncbi:hypothetical protein ACVMFB_003008 [Bradyrhizobium sp. USDA 4522]
MSSIEGELRAQRKDEMIDASADVARTPWRRSRRHTVDGL